MFTYFIIGTGPAGVSAAESIHKINPESQITLIGDEESGFYSRPGLAYYLTGELSEWQLSLNQAAKIRRVKGKIVSIRPKEHYVIAEDGRRFAYDRLLIATGSSACKISIPGSDLKGVVKLDNLADAREIVRLSRKSRSAVVIGGGITALELVEGLIANGVETHYLLRSDRYWPNVLDETESIIVEKRLQAHGVILHHQCQQSRIIGHKDKVIGVEAENGEMIKCTRAPILIRAETVQTARLAITPPTGLKPRWIIP